MKNDRRWTAFPSIFYTVFVLFLLQCSPVSAQDVPDSAAPPERMDVVVTYAREDDSEHTVTIVGIDEADVDKAQVSWISPIARALMKARVGDTVEIRTPAGRETIEVVKIAYER